MFTSFEPARVQHLSQHMTDINRKACLVNSRHLRLDQHASSLGTTELVHSFLVMAEGC